MFKIEAYYRNIEVNVSIIFDKEKMSINSSGDMVSPGHSFNIKIIIKKASFNRTERCRML